MVYPAVVREGCVYHQGGLVALIHRFSSFLFYGGRSGVSGDGGCASPLDFSRPSTSGYRKESNRYRRLSVAPLAGVERRGRGTLGSVGLAVGDTRFPSVGLPPYPGIPSLYWRMPPVPSGAKLWRERFRLC